MKCFNNIYQEPRTVTNMANSIIKPKILNNTAYKPPLKKSISQAIKKKFLIVKCFLLDDKIHKYFTGEWGL